MYSLFIPYHEVTSDTPDPGSSGPGGSCPSSIIYCLRNPCQLCAGVTGGGSATPVYPSTIEELIAYLTDPSPQNIVIERTFDFVGSEGTKTYSACNAYACSPSEGGQALLNTLDGCGSLATYEVTLDAAGVEGINVASDKTLVGLGINTVLNGKGLRFVGVSNIIIQNIEITNLNPQYVWGGDAFVFSDTDLIWIDRVTTSSLGRQHYSFGQSSDNGVTISNSFINGVTEHSATCDGHTYWGLELVGSSDQITFYSKSLRKISLQDTRDQKQPMAIKKIMSTIPPVAAAL